MWKVKFIFSTVILLATFCFKHGTTEDDFSRSRFRSDYGENCSKSIRCRSSPWLSCDPEDGICRCAKQNEMIYNTTLGKCLTLVGERCKYEVAGTLDKAKVFETADCVEGAKCSATGVCRCLPFHYENAGEYKCSLQRTFEEPCNSHLQCNATQRLTCVDNHCLCFSPGNMRWNNETKDCRILPGRDCDLGKSWMVNETIQQLNLTTTKELMHISSIRGVLRKASCVSGTSCNGTLICSCPHGFYINYTQGICSPVKEKGSHCLTEEECNSDKMLTCIKGQCICNPNISDENTMKRVVKIDQGQGYRYGVYKVEVIVELGACVIKAGSYCNYEWNNTYYEEQWRDNRRWRICVPNSECDNKAFSCKCNSGYEPTQDGTCGLTYGKKCSLDSFCSDKFVCSRRTFNATDMTCLCPNQESQRFDPTYAHTGYGNCRGYVGTVCDAMDQYACVDNAKCFTNRNTSTGYCKCTEGFVETAGGECEIEYNQSCEKSISICDRDAGLICRIIRGSDQTVSKRYKQVCSCPKRAQVYEPERRKCSTPLGFKCGKNEECVRNAVCDFDQEKPFLSGRCGCKEGFVGSDDQVSCNPVRSTGSNATMFYLLPTSNGSLCS